MVLSPTTVMPTMPTNCLARTGRQADCEAAIKLALDMGIDLFILEVEGFPCEWREYLKASCDNMKKFAQ